MNKLIFLIIGVILSSEVIIYGQVFEDKSNRMPVHFTTGATMDVESADLDQDGDLDLVLAMEVGENLIFFNDGSGKFSLDSERLLPEFNKSDNWPGEDSEDIGIADFDQDGDDDILFVSEDTPAHELLLNDGSGKFTFASYQFPSSVANALGIIDLNSDDRPDVIIGNKGQNRVFINQGNATFKEETSTRFPVNNDYTQDIKLVDVDMDGDLDLVEGIEYGGNNLYLNDEGIFTEANDRLPTLLGLIETRKVTVGDLNGDNAPDIFYSNVQWVNGANSRDLLFLNDGTGHFSNASNNLPFNIGFTLDAIFLDVNGDDYPDIITTGIGNAAPNVKVYINDGNAHFTEKTAEILPEITFSSGIGLHTADFNKDGKPDLYFSNHKQADRLFFFRAEVTSTSNLDKENPIRLFPNPTDTFLKVELSQEMRNEGIQLLVLNTLGSTIINRPIQPNEQQFELKVDDLPRGNYAVVLKTKDGRQWSEAWVKS